MQYTLEFTKQAIKELLKISYIVRDNIIKKLKVLVKNPKVANNNIKKLHGLDDCYRLRVGDYRVIYRIRDEVCIIEIIKVAHRKEVYQ